MSNTPELLARQLRAQAAAILAEGIVLSTFQNNGVAGVEREEPVRRFLRNQLPGRFYVGQGSIASTDVVLKNQNDIIVADKDLCFFLLNTLSAQLFPIESVHLIVEVRTKLGDLNGVAKSLCAARGLSPKRGLVHLPDKECRSPLMGNDLTQ